MPFTTVTVTGHLEREDRVPAEGTVTFTLSGDLRNGSQVIAATPIQVVLDDTGAFSVGLVATDDAGTLPVGAQYTIQTKVAGERTQTHTVPLSHLTSPVDITALF